MQRIFGGLPLLSILLYTGLGAGSAGAQPAGRDLFAEIDPILEELARVTGLPMKKRVDRGFISKDHLKGFLAKRLADTVSPEELRVESLTLRLFGFIPPDYDLEGSTVALLTEQAAAFYDYRKKKMFILESAPEATQRYVLIHELAHALADQHFNLARFIQRGKSDDSATARLAVMEGQAQWIMYEVMAKKTGPGLREDPGMARMMANLGESGISQYPELANAPLYIRQSLLFPYTRGFLFQNELVARLGNAAFSEVFRHPPDSTQQILHPELYLSHTAPPALDLPPRPPGFKELTTGSFGEFDAGVLFSQYGDPEEASGLAAHWKAGRFRVSEKSRGGEAILQLVVEWDTEAAAIDFAAFYEQQVIPKKPAYVSGSARVQREGTRVSSLERMR